MECTIKEWIQTSSTSWSGLEPNPGSQHWGQAFCRAALELPGSAEADFRRDQVGEEVHTQHFRWTSGDGIFSHPSSMLCCFFRDGRRAWDHKCATALPPAEPPPDHFTDTGEEPTEHLPMRGQCRCGAKVLPPGRVSASDSQPHGPSSAAQFIQL